MEPVKVAVVGFGTIGTGVARLLLGQTARLARHAGRPLCLEHVVDVDLRRPRDVQLPPGVLTDDLQRVKQNADIKVVVELIGGLEPARSIVLQLLECGKDIVTANKALLAEHGQELFDRARALGRSIAFEAAVAGGIPIIANISQCLSANQILSLQGILNGTSNFIISQMEDPGRDYQEAVAEAQRRGYAEANPAMDVNGSDAAQKLAILAHLAFGARVQWRDIPRIGIDTLDAADLRYARELGYRIKLLAVAQLTDEGLELHVSPTLVRIGHPLSEVREAYNAISVVGDAVGRLFYHGLGAGQNPTASAVVADIIDTIVGRTKITFRTLELWSERKVGVPVRDFAKLLGRYYLRLTVDDRPGVLAQIAGVLGQHHISIASVIQHEPDQSGDHATVPLVIMTHAATEGDTQAAISEINHLPCVRAEAVRMRVLDS
jgi:homoserine dehydrogenase